MSDITILEDSPITLQLTEGNSRPIIIGGGDPIVLEIVESIVAGTVNYPAPTALDDLTDVILTAPASQQMLVFQSVSNKWENQANVPNHANRHYMGSGDDSYIDASQLLTGTIALARLPDPTIDYVSTINTTDVALTTASTVYTVASISLPAGTWMINAQTVLTQGLTAGSAAMTMFIYNATTPAYLSSTSAHKASVTSTSQGLNCSAVVVLTVTSTIQMRAVSTIGAYTARYLSTTGNYDGASSLYAVRIAP